MNTFSLKLLLLTIFSTVLSYPLIAKTALDSAIASDIDAPGSGVVVGFFLVFWLLAIIFFSALLFILWLNRKSIRSADPQTNKVIVGFFVFLFGGIDVIVIYLIIQQFLTYDWLNSALAMLSLIPIILGLLSLNGLLIRPCRLTL
jgi:hypothetical protein